MKDYIGIILILLMAGNFCHAQDAATSQNPKNGGMLLWIGNRGFRNCFVTSVSADGDTIGLNTAVGKMTIKLSQQYPETKAQLRIACAGFQKPTPATTSVARPINPPTSKTSAAEKYRNESRIKSIDAQIARLRQLKRDMGSNYSYRIDPRTRNATPANLSTVSLKQIDEQILSLERELQALTYRPYRKNWVPTR